VAEPKQTLLGTTELFLTGDFDIQFCVGILLGLRKGGWEVNLPILKVVKA